MLDLGANCAHGIAMFHHPHSFSREVGEL